MVKLKEVGVKKGKKSSLQVGDTVRILSVEGIDNEELHEGQEGTVATVFYLDKELLVGFVPTGIEQAFLVSRTRVEKV